MVLIGLLVLALACLVVGLVTGSAPWLLGSLIASAVAGYLLWKEREHIGARSGVHKDQSAPKVSSAAKQPQAPARAVQPDREQHVWVVDTLPQFHARDCAAIVNLEAEAISRDQAVQDGFGECTVCKPIPATATQYVWVVDGRPDYHVGGCRSMAIAASQQSRDAEQIPRGQAVDDGFSACPDCRPDGADRAVATDTPARTPGRTPKTVWVVDGRPRYHLSDCMIIKDQQAEEIPFEQATGDGFMACTMCAPSAARV